MISGGAGPSLPAALVCPAMGHSRHGDCGMLTVIVIISWACKGHLDGVGRDFYLFLNGVAT